MERSIRLFKQGDGYPLSKVISFIQGFLGILDSEFPISNFYTISKSNEYDHLDEDFAPTRNNLKKDDDSLLKLLWDSNKEDLNGDVMSDSVTSKTGFSTSFYYDSKDKKESMSIRVNFGATSPRLKDSIVINFSGYGNNILERVNIKSLFLQLVEYFNPDWATFDSFEHKKRIKKVMDIGYLNYFSSKLFLNIKDHQNIQIEDFNGGKSFYMHDENGNIRIDENAPEDIFALLKF